MNQVATLRFIWNNVKAGEKRSDTIRLGTQTIYVLGQVSIIRDSLITPGSMVARFFTNVDRRPNFR